MMTEGRFRSGVGGTGGGANPRLSFGGSGVFGRGPNRTGFAAGGGPSGGVAKGATGFDGVSAFWGGKRISSVACDSNLRRDIGAASAFVPDCP